MAAQERELQQYLAFEEDCLCGGKRCQASEHLPGTQEFSPSLGINLLADSVLTCAHQM